ETRKTRGKAHGRVARPGGTFRSLSPCRGFEGGVAAGRSASLERVSAVQRDGAPGHLRGRALVLPESRLGGGVRGGLSAGAGEAPWLGAVVFSGAPHSAGSHCRGGGGRELPHVGAL